MALLVVRAAGFETGGLEELESFTGSPAAALTLTGPPAISPRSGSYMLRVNNTDYAQIYSHSALAMANWKVSVAITRVPPADTVLFQVGPQDMASTFVEVWMSSSGAIVLKDRLGTTLDTSAATYSADGSWINISVCVSNATGSWQWHINGSEEGNGTTTNFTGQPQANLQYIRLFNVGGSGYYSCFDDIIISRFSTTFEDASTWEVIPYWSTLASAAPDYTTSGDPNLTTGQWVDAQTQNWSDASLITYANTGQMGCIWTNDAGGSAGTGGPNTDANIGTIKGAQYQWRLERGNGGGTTHTVYFGRDSSPYVTSAVVDPLTSPSQFYQSLYYSASEIPTASDYLSIGMGVSGAKDLTCYDMLAYIVNEPTSGPTAYTLQVDTGTYAITGTDPLLKAAKSMDAAIGSYAITGVDAALSKTKNLPAAIGSYAITGVDPALTAQRALPAVIGAYTLLGQDVALSRTVRLQLETGSYAITGGDVALNKAKNLAAEIGSYAITGVDPALTAARTLSAETGAYVITGGDAVLGKSRIMQAATGSYEIVTTHGGGGATDNVSLYAHRYIGAGPGAYNITGIDITFAGSATMQVDTGAYTVSGVDAALNRGFVLKAETGAYVVTGSGAGSTGLYVQRYIGAGPGAYAVTGVNPNLQTQGAFQLDTGSYQITGVDVALKRSYRMQVDTGSYAVSGVDVALSVTRSIQAETGSYAITGVNPDLKTQGSFKLDVGDYTITGQDAALTRQLRLPVETGSYVVSGVDTGLSVSFSLPCDTGAYALTGVEPALKATRTLQAQSGAYSVTGVDVALTATQGHELLAQTGTYALSGIDAALQYNQIIPRRVFIVC